MIKTADRLVQKGFTLIEFSMVLAAIGVLTAGVMFGIGSLSNDVTDGGFAQSFNPMVKEVKKLKMMGDYGADTDLGQIMLDNSKVPPFFSPKTGTIKHPYGGVITFTGKNSFFAATITNLPKTDCFDTLTQLSSGFIRVFVDANTTPPADVTTGGLSTPLSSAQINTACGAGTLSSVHLISN